MVQFSENQIRSVTEIDAKFYCKGKEDQKVFCDKNNYAYYILCNTWYWQIAEVSPEGSYFMADSINRYGLRQLIAEASTLADHIVRDDIEGYLMSENTVNKAWLYDLVMGCTTDSLGKRRLLQLLRYPKRLTVTGSSVLRESTLAAFIDRNKANRDFERTETSKPLFAYVTGYARDMLRTYVMRTEYAFLDDVDNADAIFTHAIDSGKVTSGSTAKGAITQLEKYAECMEMWGGMAIPYATVPRHYPEEYDRMIPKGSLAPKNYKVMRHILMEHAGIQFVQQGLSSILYAATRGDFVFPRNGQDINRELCRYASITGALATLDISQASDSICGTVSGSILPKGWLSAYKSITPDFMEVNGRVTRRYIPFGSGGGCTYAAESMVFLSIAMAATHCWLSYENVCVNGVTKKPIIRVATLSEYYPEMYAELDPKIRDSVKVFVCGTKRRELTAIIPQAVGDDIICDDRCAEVVLDFLRVCGFDASESKSFYHDINGSYYRESCGLEYLDGIRLDSSYFPRKEVTRAKTGVDETPLSRVIQLQHRLFSNVRCRAFLNAEVRNIIPDMTCHPVGSECSDLWSNIEECKPKYLPFIKGHGFLDTEYPLVYETTYHTLWSWKYRMSLFDSKSGNVITVVKYASSLHVDSEPWYSTCDVVYRPLVDNSIDASHVRELGVKEWDCIARLMEQQNLDGTILEAFVTTWYTTKQTNADSIIAKGIERSERFKELKASTELARKRMPHYVEEAIPGTLNKAAINLYRDLYDLICYIRFLKCGPTYDSALDRLLGVSSARQPIEHVGSSQQTVWRKVDE